MYGNDKLCLVARHGSAGLTARANPSTKAA